MKRLITLLCMAFCLFTFVKAETWVLDFGPNGLNYTKNTGLADGLLENGNGASVTGASSRSDGTLRLVKNREGNIELPALLGVISIDLDRVSDITRLEIQKYDAASEAWIVLTTASAGAGNVYCADVSQLGDCTLRLLSKHPSGTVDIGKITVVYCETIPGPDPGDVEYESKEIIHEQFNTTFKDNAANWEEKAEGNWTFTIPVVGSETGYGIIKLTAYSVELTGNQTGATSTGRLRCSGTSGIVELPEISSCGTITLNTNAGSASGKSITIQKKSGDNWIDVKTVDLTNVPATYFYDVNSAAPVTLRIITSNSGAKNIYELWVTDYVAKAVPVITVDCGACIEGVLHYIVYVDDVALENEVTAEEYAALEYANKPDLPTDCEECIGTAIKDLNGQGKIVSVTYSDLRGMSLQKAPLSGLFIQKTVYDTGSIEISKIFKNKK
jgi:hypothetical protein